MNKLFEGYYLKHQNDSQTLAFIPGRSKTEAFIQVVTDDRSYHVSYPLRQYSTGSGLRVGGSFFSKKGIQLDINQDELTIRGTLRYGPFTPIGGDIMGPFRFFPMECRHTVVSMRHPVKGTLYINGQPYAFENGTGYIEGDSGRSFPSSYSWVHCNRWNAQRDDCSVMASIAEIPFAGLRFQGCIAVVWLNGQEYRFATYKGVKIRRRTRQDIELTQGGMRLAVHIPAHTGHSLKAPDLGDMKRTIHESAAVRARFLFQQNGQTLLDRWSGLASYEFVQSGDSSELPLVK